LGNLQHFEGVANGELLSADSIIQFYSESAGKFQIYLNRVTLKEDGRACSECFDITMNIRFPKSGLILHKRSQNRDEESVWEENVLLDPQVDDKKLVAILVLELAPTILDEKTHTHSIISGLIEDAKHFEVPEELLYPEPTPEVSEKPKEPIDPEDPEEPELTERDIPEFDLPKDYQSTDRERRTLTTGSGAILVEDPELFKLIPQRWIHRTGCWIPPPPRK